MINIDIVQIAISYTSSLSCTGFYVMRWENMEDDDTEKYHVSSLIQGFVFSSKKIGCIRCISSQVCNKTFETGMNTKYYKE